jgi:hypothetical protein
MIRPMVFRDLSFPKAILAHVEVAFAILALVSKSLNVFYFAHIALNPVIYVFNGSH